MLALLLVKCSSPSEFYYEGNFSEPVGQLLAKMYLITLNTEIS